MKKSAIFIIAMLATAMFASAELKSGTMSSTMVTAPTTNLISVTGEVLSIGIRSSNTNAYSVAITDYATGAPIYTGTGLVATSYNLFPRVIATGTSGSTLSDTNGNIYVPVSVSKMRVIASCTTANSNTLTVAAVVNAAP